MPSPFPGMDPYVEAQGLWERCRAELIYCSAEVVNSRLPEGYVARIETRVTFVTQEIAPSRRVPDVLIGREADAPTVVVPSSHHGAEVATIAPITIPFAVGEVEIHERWIEILSLPEMNLVTVLEILSPTNKLGTGRIEYLEKRAGLIDGTFNVVEIDLLLGGRRMPMAKPLPPGDFYAVVGRISKTGNAEVYAWTIRDVLPTVPIPLRAPDPDVPLDLRKAFDLAYDRSLYPRLLRYGKPLPDTLPLSPTDREWAESL
jgi:hypothetical protein